MELFVIVGVLSGSSGCAAAASAAWYCRGEKGDGEDQRPFKTNQIKLNKPHFPVTFLFCVYFVRTKFLWAWLQWEGSGRGGEEGGKGGRGEGGKGEDFFWLFSVQ